MVGGVSYCAEEGIVSIFSEVSKCRLVITVKSRAPSATEKGLQALHVCCSGKTPPCTIGVYWSLAMMTALYTVCWSSQFIP